jgi:hypothetical protein
MMKDETTRLAPRPASPSPGDRNVKGIQPYELDSELAQLKIVERAIVKMPSMAIISRPFIVRQGIFTALNHTPMTYREIAGVDRVIDLGNPTGYDSSLRLAVYEHVAKHSVNVDGEYFHSFWAFAMKPRMIIQGMNPMGQPMEQEKGESIFSRMVGWIRGGKKDGRTDT